MNTRSHPAASPHAIPAEQELLGAILMDGRAVLDRIEGIVTAADFYREDHRRIFAAAKALHDAGKTPDFASIDAALAAAGELASAGGTAYLAELAGASLSAANARRHAEIIQEHSTRRQLQQIGVELHEACALPGHRSSAEIAADIETRLLQVVDRTDTEPTRIHQAMVEVLKDVDDRRERGGRLAGLATGFARFDEMTGGLEPGQLVIVAARPSVGKTILGCNIAAHAAAGGSIRRVLHAGDEPPGNRGPHLGRPVRRDSPSNAQRHECRRPLERHVGHHRHLGNLADVHR